jgi:hypothetical protein
LSFDRMVYIYTKALWRCIERAGFVIVADILHPSLVIVVV